MVSGERRAHLEGGAVVRSVAVSMSRHQLAVARRQPSASGRRLPLRGRARYRPNPLTAGRSHTNPSFCLTALDSSRAFVLEELA